MGKDRLVVVFTRLSVERHEEFDMFVARFRKLGLTAYGSTREKAISSYKRLFNRFVQQYRRAGCLEKRLDQAGVEWCWADQYSGQYENTNTETVEGAVESRSEIVLPAAA